MISILEHIHENYIAHTDDESPLVIKKKVFGGDVLTNERAYTAQLAMMNSPTDYTKLKGVIHRPEGLHRIMNFLLFIYQRLYKSSSAADPGTLYQLRNVIHRVDVKGPDDVVSSYRAHYCFIEDCLDGYIVGACMHLLGMVTMDSDPPRVPFLCKEDRYNYIHGVAKNILDKHVKIGEAGTREVDSLKHQMEEMYDSSSRNYLCTCWKRYKTDGWFKKHLVSDHDWNFTMDTDSNESKLDHIALYRSSFMKCALLLRDTNDAYKYGDGDRILRNSKFEMLCAVVGKHLKYRLWLFRFIAYCIALLSEKQSKEYLWNRTANIAGGLGKTSQMTILWRFKFSP